MVKKSNFRIVFNTMQGITFEWADIIVFKKVWNGMNMSHIRSFIHFLFQIMRTKISLKISFQWFKKIELLTNILCLMFVFCC